MVNNLQPNFELCLRIVYEIEWDKFSKNIAIFQVKKRHYSRVGSDSSTKLELCLLVLVFIIVYDFIKFGIELLVRIQKGKKCNISGLKGALL